MSMPEAVQSAKQRLATLAASLKRNTGDLEARRLNRIESNVYSQWEGNGMRTD